MGEPDAPAENAKALQKGARHHAASAPTWAARNGEKLDEAHAHGLSLRSCCDRDILGSAPAPGLLRRPLALAEPQGELRRSLYSDDQANGRERLADPPSCARHASCCMIAHMQPVVIYEGQGRTSGKGPSTHSRESLASLPAGRCGRISLVYATTSDLERLEVMGLCAGRVVQVVKAGDPMIVRVLGTRIGLAAALARDIYVEPVERTVP